MLEIPIPGAPTLTLEHLVLDYNGTLAVDGALLDGVAPRLEKLAQDLDLHVLSADTFGTVRRALASLPVQVTVVEGEDQAAAKALHIKNLGAAHVAAIGNGRIDVQMLQVAVLGIAVVEAEGAATATLAAADVVCTSIGSALDLLLFPHRLQATLRR